MYFFQSWHDIQSRTKTKKGKLNAYALRTGGGPAVPNLTSSEEEIVEIIGNTAIRGLKVQEPLVKDITIEENLPSTSQLYTVEPSMIKSVGFVQENLPSTSHPSMVEISVAIDESKIENEHNYNSNCEKKTFTHKPQTETDPHKRKPRNIATQRLQKAVDQSNKSIDLLHQKIELKRNYFTKKLQLMERDVVSKENLVSVLKDFLNK